MKFRKRNKMRRRLLLHPKIKFFDLYIFWKNVGGFPMYIKRDYTTCNKVEVVGWKRDLTCKKRRKNGCFPCLTCKLYEPKERYANENI